MNKLRKIKSKTSNETLQIFLKLFINPDRDDFEIKFKVND